MSDFKPLAGDAGHERPLPPAWDANPFQAPTAHVEDAREGGDGSLLAEPKKVAAGRGLAWWSGGWEMYREAPWRWVGITAALIVGSLVFNFVPVLSLAFYILFPILGGGLMLGCHSLDKGHGLAFGHLFAGFQKNLGELALVGVFYLVGVIVMLAIIFVAGFGGGVGASMLGSGGNAALVGGLLGSLVALAISVPLVMAIWFAPALVALDDVPAFKAMKLSFLGCQRNLAPFLIYGLVGIVLAIPATLPALLGWLVLLPVMLCGSYRAYRDIFLA